MPSILIVVATVEGQTRKIAEFLAGELRRRGHTVEIVDPTTSPRDWREPEPDGVLLAGSVHVGKHAPALTRFATAHRWLLAERPSAFLSVSLSAHDPSAAAESRGYVDAFLVETGWEPALVGTAAGALRYSRYGFLKKLLMKRIARKAGLPTDTSRDHELTDWDGVREFGVTFLQRLEPTVPA